MENFGKPFFETAPNDPKKVGRFRSDISNAMDSGNVLGVIQPHLQRMTAETVKNEIDNMIYEDMADVALAAADAIGDADLAKRAAEVVRNSGSYNRERLKNLLVKYQDRG